MSEAHHHDSCSVVNETLYGFGLLLGEVSRHWTLWKFQLHCLEDDLPVGSKPRQGVFSNFVK